MKQNISKHFIPTLLALTLMSIYTRKSRQINEM